MRVLGALQERFMGTLDRWMENYQYIDFMDQSKDKKKQVIKENKAKKESYKDICMRLLFNLYPTF